MQEEEPCKTVAQAARRGHPDEMKHLIIEGHPVDVQDNRGWMAIHDAADGNFTDCLIHLLLQESTDVNFQSFDGKTALHIAASGGHVECLKILLEHGAECNLTDSWFETPLFPAIRSKSLDCVLELLAHDIDVNRQAFDNSTALHVAVTCDQREMIQHLLTKGARIDLMQDEDITPVFLASHLGRSDCLCELVSHLKSSDRLDVLNQCAADGASSLFLAAQEGFIECIRLLLDNGADANLPTKSPVALPLHAALQFNRIDCVEAILKATDLDRLPDCSISPYYFSMMHEDAEATESLIRARVDFNAAFESVDDDQYQPKVLRYFNSEISYGRRFTPLVIIALYEYSLKHAQLLLEAGAICNACSSCRVPPLLPALDMFNLELVSMLINAGADVNTYHRRVIGNMSLIVCLHFWRGLEFMLNCGAEVESLFAERSVKSLPPEVSFDSDSENPEDNVGVMAVPISFWRLIAEARYVMTRRGITVAQVLMQLLLYTGSHRLDARLAGYVDSTDDWIRIKALAEQPRTLAHLCRLRIRRSFTAQQLIKNDLILSLPLPIPLLNYLLYVDHV